VQLVVVVCHGCVADVPVFDGDRRHVAERGGDLLPWNRISELALQDHRQLLVSRSATFAGFARWRTRRDPSWVDPVPWLSES
jgi:hypothetical protein